MACLLSSVSVMRTCLLLLPLLAGCVTVGPDYEQPVAAVPDAWHTELIGPFQSGTAPLHTWWKSFDDPVLDQLIEKARANNLDLKIAMARIAAAASELGIAEGANLPGVSMDGASTVNRASQNGPLGALGDRDFQMHALNLRADWEIDLFGGIRRQVESAGAAYEASIEDYRDVMVVLLADVASNYILVRTLQTRIRFTKANIAAQLGSLTLARARNNAGLAPDLDVTQAESNLGISEALVPALEQRLQRARNRLAVLLGEQPGKIDGMLADASPIPSPPTEVVVGIPADLVRQRPDIRAAERRLASQHARIGVVQAELYPKFFLFGSVGVASTDVGSLFSSASGVYTFGPGFRWNIWQGGRIRSLKKVEEAGTDAALVAYEQAILQAFEEVENAVYGFGRQEQRRGALDRATKANERSVHLVLVLYRAGLVNFQNVLGSQRSLLEVQNNLSRSEGLRSLQLVALYRALGGGWEEAPEQP